MSIASYSAGIECDVSAKFDQKSLSAAEKLKSSSMETVTSIGVLYVSD